MCDGDESQQAPILRIDDAPPSSSSDDLLNGSGECSGIGGNSSGLDIRRNTEEPEELGDAHLQSEQEFDFGEATDDDSDEQSSVCSANRSLNLSSRDWFQSPENELAFGCTDLNEFLHDSGGSLDAFVDALDECFDIDKDQEVPNDIKGSGRPDLCDEGDQSETDCPENNILFDDKHSLDFLPGTCDDQENPLEEPQQEQLTGYSKHSFIGGSSEEIGAAIIQDKEPVVVKLLQQDPPLVLADSATSEEAKLRECHVESSSPKVKKKCIMRLGSKEAEELLQIDVSKILRSTSKNGTDWSKEYLGPDELSRYVEAVDVKETYIDTVQEMEDILLDSEEDRGTHHFWTNRASPSRDGSLTASSTATGILNERFLMKVESVEVVGARQKRGGASLGERVVGVREHTIYRIRIKGAGKEWEVERRYRDFIDLFYQLKRHARTPLPTPWEKVGNESRKIFGNTSPDVVEIRSALLQVCLQSCFQAGTPLSTAIPLLRFLSPGSQQTVTSSHLDSSSYSSLSSREDSSLQLKEFVGSPRSPDGSEAVVPFGKTIKLIVQIQAKRSLKQQLMIQRSLCAGCYEPLLSSSMNLVSGILGWGKPRLCEYTGQVFCSSCHLNETALLPAQVLQLWDFSTRPVSQLVKSYLDSIFDQPMLCVSAVNPFLYSKVAILGQVGEMRRKLSRMIGCISCPSRSRIQHMLGSRRYLLEHDDFYALRDLADLSKGAFAVLPGILENALEKLWLHVNEKCVICHELGECCASGPFCDTPSNLIYPFQDEESVHRCQLCHAAFHMPCFKTVGTCPSCTRDPDPTADRTPLSSLSSSSYGEYSPAKPKRKLFASLLGKKEEKVDIIPF